ncbi:MAG: 50S ribosomal protein L31 [Candidatus Sungiibacteriota bacterium]
MKKTIHLPYHQAAVRCACGNAFTVGSTKQTLEIEICSACHPFYTGGSKIIDTAGRVEKFKARLAHAKAPGLAKKKPAKQK